MAESYTNTPLSKELAAVYKMDKGKLDDSETFQKKSLANNAYNFDLRLRNLYKAVDEFAFPLRFCIFPTFKYN